MKMISLTSPIKTRAHFWPAGAKLAALCLSTAGLFFIQNLFAHIAILTAILALYAAPGRLFFTSGLSKLWMLWPFVIIVCGWHWVTDSYVQGVVIVLRLVSAVALANLVTMTTRITDMIDVVRVFVYTATIFRDQLASTRNCNCPRDSYDTDFVGKRTSDFRFMASQIPTKNKLENRNTFHPAGLGRC